MSDCPKCGEQMYPCPLCNERGCVECELKYHEPSGEMVHSECMKEYNEAYTLFWDSIGIDYTEVDRRYDKMRDREIMGDT